MKLKKKSLLKPKLGKNNSKYHNIITVQDGIKFDSKAEAMRYSVLSQQQELGVISDLKLQQSYKLTINGEKFAKYIADFTYILNSTGEKVVEDVKNPSLASANTPFSLKKKAMKIIHDIDIKVIHPNQVMIF